MKEFNINKLVRANVSELTPYSSARDEYKELSKDMVFLDANENPYENGINRYPDPQQHDLKVFFATEKSVKTSNILLGNGSDEVLDLIFRAFCEPNIDNIITLPPTYGMYGVLANINAIENKKVLLTTDFNPDVQEIWKAVDNSTKIIFLCSPNNPTGNSFSEEIVSEILNDFNGLVVIDEAYIDFSEQESWLNRINEFPNLIITQTLSKAYGMAGIRLGLCYASEEIIAILNKIKPPYNVNKLTQERALLKVKDKAIFRAEITNIKRAKVLLVKSLLEIKVILEVHDSDANFVLVRVSDANKIYKELIAKGIVIRNRTTQPLCENTLRFTIGTPEENTKLINALKSL